MSDRGWWIGILAGGSTLAIGLGVLIYFQYEKVEAIREEVAGLEGQIASSRQLLGGTVDLEREVIVRRETEETIKEILPDEEALNDFVRGLRKFEEDSEVRITGYKKKQNKAPGAAQAAGGFEKVTYNLNLEADAFQYLSFLNRLDTHSRFLSVPSFKLVAASRSDVEAEGIASHRIQIDVETYVYQPSAGPAPVKIEGYERKRELLLSEISKSRQALRVREYDYRGPRGRRDPWVDPRVPVDDGDETTLSVEEQIQIVEDLVLRARGLDQLWETYELSQNVIQEMTNRAELENNLAQLEVDIRRIQEENTIRFVPSLRRLQLEVVDRAIATREKMSSREGGRGPTIETLTEVLDGMREHMAAGEFDMALMAFSVVELRLDYVKGDPNREPLAQRLASLAQQATIASEFAQLELEIGGRAVMEGVDPVVLIGGRTLGEGDLVGSDLIIRSIRTDEIEFIYRGVILIRRL